MATTTCPLQSHSYKRELHRISQYSGFRVLTSVRCFGSTSQESKPGPIFGTGFCEAANHRVLFDARELTMPACLAENGS
jgi:hypothetical protein